MNVSKRLTQIKEERGWFKYKIAMKSKLPQEMVSKLFYSDYDPTITVIVSLCNGLGMSLSEFFIEDTNNDIEKDLIGEIAKLNVEQKVALYKFLKSNNL